jgi:hypothetical protein
MRPVSSFAFSMMAMRTSMLQHSRSMSTHLSTADFAAHSGNRLQSLANIALGMLLRLRKAGKVRTHGENWMLT